MLFSCSVIYRATPPATLFGQFPYGVLRISLPRTPVNKGEVGESGPLSPAPTYTLPQQERHQEGNDDERNPDCTPPRPRARRHSLTLCERGFLPSVSIRVGVFGPIPKEPPYLGHRPEDHPLDEKRWLGEVNLVFVVVHDEGHPKRVLGNPRDRKSVV